MLPLRQSSRIDIIELKARIVKKLGHDRAEKYFHYLQKFISLKISKSKFNKLCLNTIGRENVALHNQFIVSILKNAYLSKTAPLCVTKEEGSSNGKTTNIGHPSPRKCRSKSISDCKFRDHHSPLGPSKKIQGAVHATLISRSSQSSHKLSTSTDLKVLQEQRNVPEVISIGSKAFVEVASVEDGEEVEQAAFSPCIQSRSPVRAPFGIPISIGGAHKELQTGFASPFHLNMSDIHETCCSSSVLPDAKTLRKRLEQRLEIEGLNVSIDCINLLNNGLDAFLRRLIRPCMELAQARCGHAQMMVNSAFPGKYVQRSSQSFSASLLDFRAAIELNPQLLGEYWPAQVEKVCLRSLEE